MSHAAWTPKKQQQQQQQKKKKQKNFRPELAAQKTKSPGVRLNETRAEKRSVGADRDESERLTAHFLNAQQDNEPSTDHQKSCGQVAGGDVFWKDTNLTHNHLYVFEDHTMDTD